jgi:hypothetical protein
MINLDNNDANSDWIRSSAWDLPRTPESLLYKIGASRWEHFKTLPSFKAIPEGLEAEVDALVRARMPKSAKALLANLNKYDPDQPREANGRFGSGGADVVDTGDNVESTHAENLQNLWATVITTTADGMGGDVADSINDVAGSDMTSANAIAEWASNDDVRAAVKETVANDLMQQEVLAAVPTQDLITAASGGFANAFGSNGEGTPTAGQTPEVWSMAMASQTNEDAASEKYGIDIVEYNSVGGINVFDYSDVIDTSQLRSGEVTLEQVQQGLDDLDNGARYAIAGSPEAEAFIRENATSVLINQWAQTSNNNNPCSQAMQQAAAQQFNLDNHAEWDGMEGDLKIATDAAYAANGAVYSAFLQAQYDNTQDQLKAAGIESITVYRGSTIGDWSAQEVSTRPMSSWSTSFGTAAAFGGEGVIYRTEIPAAQIMSTAGTGFGCLNEFEIVALGGTYAVDALDLANVLEESFRSEATDGSYQEDGTLIDQLFANAKV